MQFGDVLVVTADATVVRPHKSRSGQMMWTGPRALRLRTAGIPSRLQTTSEAAA